MTVNLNTPNISNYLSHGNLVAGAASEGHGALVNWHGRGRMTHADLMQVVYVDAGLPQEWLPAVKDAAVQLGRAMQHVAGNAYLAKPVRKTRDADGAVIETWAARWILVRLPSAEAVIPGDKFGDITVVATLWDADSSAIQLRTEPTTDPTAYSYREDLKARIQAAYDARIASEIHEASDITAWLGRLLRKECGAVRYGGAYYVPRGGRDVAGAVCDALRVSGWGVHWMQPMLPVATSAELSLGLALGLMAEVDELASAVAIARDKAREAGKADIGMRAHKNAVERLGVVVARIRTYTDVLGAERLTECLNRCADFEVTLDEIERAHA